jgi:hypothetical protein
MQFPARVLRWVTTELKASVTSHRSFGGQNLPRSGAPRAAVRSSLRLLATVTNTLNLRQSTETARHLEHKIILFLIHHRFSYFKHSLKRTKQSTVGNMVKHVVLYENGLNTKECNPNLAIYEHLHQKR